MPDFFIERVKVQRKNGHLWHVIYGFSIKKHIDHEKKNSGNIYSSHFKFHFSF